MTKRVTPATTAIGVITVTLLVAGGTRLFSTTAASAAGTTPVTVGQIAVSPSTLPPDGQSSAVVTVTGGQACASGLLSTPTATFSTDGASLFGTSQSGPWTSTLKVNFDNTGNAQTYVQATNAPGIENIWATLSGSGGLLGLGGSSGCTGQTPNAQLTEVGTPASITLDAPNPARVQTGAASVAVTAHVLDASSFPVPGQTVVLFRSSAPTTQIPMTDAGGGNYTVTIPASTKPMAEQLVAFDATGKGKLGKESFKWAVEGFLGGFSSPVIDGDHISFTSLSERRHGIVTVCDVKLHLLAQDAVFDFAKRAPTVMR